MLLKFKSLFAILGKHKLLTLVLIGVTMLVMVYGAYTVNYNLNKPQATSSVYETISTPVKNDESPAKKVTDKQSAESSNNSTAPSTNSSSVQPSSDTSERDADLAAFKKCMSVNDSASASYRSSRDQLVASHRQQEDYINQNYDAFERKPLLVALYASSQQKADTLYANYKARVYSYGPTYFNTTCSPGYTSGYTFIKPYGL